MTDHAADGRPLPPQAQPKEGIVFSLAGLGELEFVQVLHDLTTDRAFRRPLQIQVQEPRGGQPGQLVLAFSPADRPLAVQAMQRLKTILLRHGVQVDDVLFPGDDGFLDHLNQA